MGESSRRGGLANSALAAALAFALASCGQIPPKPAPAHVGVNDQGARPEGAIPAPVQLVPVLPPPSPAARPETYSVVVNNVRVQDLLFALARDAKLNVDIHPGITGLVTLNAVDQTLPQLLGRISRQVDMRYEIDGQTLLVMRDVPVLRPYKVDYLSAARSSTMKSTASTQFGGAAGTGAGGGSSIGSSATGGTATIEVTAKNDLWESIVQNVKDILRETDKIIPKSAPSGAPQAPASAAPPAGAGATSGAPVTPGAQPPAPQQPVDYIESASVIGNRESGTLYVRATSRQHEKIQEFLDLVLVGAKRQVLIEATIAEVQLRNEYQRGIEWQRLAAGGLLGSTGIRLTQPAIGAPTGFSSTPFQLGYVSAGNNFTSSLKLLEQFGDVRVLSSPKLSVLNNQTAILRVTRDIIYFTLTPATISATAAVPAGGVVNIQPAFTTTPNVAAEGFMMTVLPQINDADAVVLNVRPTIRRQVGFARDPNPVLQGQTTQNDIPLFETREFDSILRLQNGGVAVLAGLMQDTVENTDTGIPGVRNIPGIGALLSQRADLTRKTELVIFLRASVIRDPTVDGDFRAFRELLPSDEFFRKPNPGRVAPLMGPSGEPHQ